MSENSAILSLPYLQPSQAQKHVTHNEALRILDIVVQLVVASRTQGTPPAVPQEGDRFIVGPGAVGPWAGHEDEIAVYETGAWQFLSALPGWRAHVLDEVVTAVFGASGWQDGVAAITASQIGVNTAADQTNRLSVSAAATLLTHEGAGHQLKLNKAAEADTASLLFQDGYSGRAEMGLAGSDDFSIKVSPDGAAFAPALTIAADTAQVTVPGVLRVDGAVSGGAVSATVHETAPGRLLKVGDYGWGQTGDTQSNGVLNAILSSGVHQFAGTDPNRPGASGGAVLVIRYAQNWVSQIAFGAGTSELWLRRTQDNGATWSGWTALTNEKGTGPNGDYVRFADGTMICTRTALSAASVATADGALFKSANVTWTFPAAFVSAPRVHGAAASDADVFATPVSSTTTQGVLRLRSTVSKAGTVTFGATAIGKWY